MLCFCLIDKHKDHSRTKSPVETIAFMFLHEEK
jgi:hypothetical protein